MNRRSLFLAASLLSPLLAASTSPLVAATIEGYAWPLSVAAGDTISIYVSTDAPVFDLEVLRLGASEVRYRFEADLPGIPQPVTGRVWETGCMWSPSQRFMIPNSWPSGVYVARLSARASKTRNAIFVVREARPGKGASILFQTSVFTWEAYNNWGGKSLYDYNSTDGQAATTVSLRRPFAENWGQGQFVVWGIALRALAGVGGVLGRGLQPILDAHLDTKLQASYPLFLVVGHDEYWTKEMRDALEARVALGQSIAIFGGNTCWWQVRVPHEADRVVCYKDPHLDPLFGVDNSRVPVNWYGSPVLRPENYLTGVSFRNGGYVNTQGWYPDTSGYGGYTAYRTEHWVFEDTGLRDGDVFGRSSTIVGYEVDGALYRWEDGLPAPTGLDGTPPGFEILALSPASRGAGTMGLLTRGSGGMVFNAATTDWAHGLAEDPTVQQITRNVIGRLAGKIPVRDSLRQHPPPAVINQNASSFHVSVQANPAHQRAAIDWKGVVGPGAVIRILAPNGRLVARLPVAENAAEGCATWDGRDMAGRRVPTGIYLAQLVGPRGHADEKFLFVR